MNHPFAFTGALLMAIGVAFGAFGAHALKAALSIEMMEIYEKAVLYQFIHALGVIFIGILAFLKFFSISAAKKVTFCFVLGIILFCGSLYIYTIFGYRPVVMITPVGGTLFIIGWSYMALKMIK